TTRKDYGSLKSVAQLADIAGPGGRGDHAASRIAQLRMGAAMNGTKRHEEVVCKKQNIGAAFAERRHREHQDIQPEKKILAETAGLDSRGEIHIREGDETSFDAQSLGSPEAFERALLQDAQKFALCPSRECGDFVENNRAAAAEF